MKYPGLLLSVFALLLTGPVLGQLGGTSAKVTASLVSEVKAAAPGQAFRAAVKLEHQDGWHTYGKVLSPGVIGKPTVLKWTLPEGWVMEELPWPATHQAPSTGGTMTEGYSGTVYLPVRLTPPQSAAVGSVADVLVKVDALVCNPENCMPAKPEARLAVAIAAQAVIDPATAQVFGDAAVAPIAPGAAVAKPSAAVAAAQPERSLFVWLVFAFVGGLILNIMPCVFPVLGIKILGVVRQSGEDHRKVVIHGLAYTAGVLACFWGLAILLLALKSSGQNLGWGFQLQSPLFVFGLTFFLFLFGLNMAGLFEVGNSAVGVGQELQTKSGYSGSFFSGLLATVVATPCSAPFLGPALGFALTLTAVPSILFFSVIGIGLSMPYLLLSLFPGLVKLLPRPGAWMESFKQFMSFLLFATVAYLIWTLDGMVDDLTLRSTLFGLVLVALGAWIYGRWTLPHRAGRVRLIGGIAAVLAVAGGLWLAWPSGHRGELEWKEWSPELVQSLRDEGKPVYIDYTARWCATCQVNKRVYKDAALKELFRKSKVVLLKADWTNEDERITKALAELGKAAVPVNVLYVPGQTEPVVLPELLTVENVSAALDGLR